MKPQLLESVKTGQLPQLLNSESWSISQKLDGERLIVETGSGNPTGWNRRGEPRALPRWLYERFKGVQSKWMFDGELLGTSFQMFDLIEAPTGSLAKAPWIQRHGLLTKVQNSLNDPAIQAVEAYATQKLDFYNLCKSEGAEGVVFNLHNATYRSGKRNSSCLKYKFVKDVDCFVISVNLDDRANMLLGMWDPDNHCEREVGRVTSLNGDGRTLNFQSGDVVTVNILYTTESGKLYQPTLPRLRHDKKPIECTIDQLDPLRTNRNVLKL